MGRLKDKVAIVTGGASGIGEAIVRLFAKEGAKVVSVDLDSEKGAALENELKEELSVQFMQGDVADEARVAEIFKEVIATYGQVDILINNAGVNTYIPSEERPYEDFKWTVDINLNSMFLWSQHAVKDMLEKEGGIIVNTASMNGVRTVGGNAAYDASKAAVIQLTRSMAQEYAARNIRINAVSPGIVKTPMVTDEIIEAMVPTIPMRRPAELEEVAKAFLFFCTDESSYITGQNLAVDGGSLTQ